MGFKMKSRCFLTVFIYSIFAVSFAAGGTEDEARQYSIVLDERYTYECNLEMVARWAYITDVDNEMAASEANDADVAYFSFQSEAATNISSYKYESFEDVDLYREFRFQADHGPGGLSKDKLTEYQDLQSTMENIYNTATVCPYNTTTFNNETCNLLLEPDLVDIMASSTDWNELKYVWEEWRYVSGRLMKDDYVRFVELSNEAAVSDGYPDTGDYWLNGYTVTQKEVDGYGNGKNLNVIDQDAFRVVVANIWEQVSEVLYKPLHAFVRMKLKDLYPNHINLTGPLPANILGNMWAQDWTNIAQYVMPFQDQPDFDVTQSMIDKGWNIDMMYLAAEDFFMSINLFNMTQDFWDKSVINQTAWGKAMECHASAEDFCLGPNSTDFRIKMCTQVNMNDLVTVHHEMGHIEYFMAYENQPHVFRDSANPGFHEAIGDLIALSVSTPGHMENILNLTSSSSSLNISSPTNYTVDEQKDLNFLMRMALEKVAFLPFGYLIDKYRWGIFDGSIKPDHYNSQWWRLREDLQGVIPPSKRARGEKNFDAGAKFHVPANVPYIRYFVSFIVQFQFQKRLCEAANFTGPLHQCDIYENTDAGAILRDSLEQGFSKPWPLILEELGNSNEMDAGPIIEYFQPLLDYFAIALEGQYIGWDTHTYPLPNEDAQVRLLRVEQNVKGSLVKDVDASWAYYTNVTDDTRTAMNEAKTEYGVNYKKSWEADIHGYNYDYVTDPYISRQFDLQQSIGTSILNATDLDQLNEHISSMTANLINQVCPYNDMKCSSNELLSIDQIQIKMADSRDYSELLYYWDKWRYNSGKKMINDYPPYVEIMNKAALANGFPDAGLMWLEPYTNGAAYTAQDFKKDIKDIFDNDIFNFYQHLHGYVRYRLKLNSEYNKRFSKDGLIPAQILGSMWSQSWVNIYNEVVPYTEVQLLDLTTTFQEKVGENVDKMFRIAEDFFISLGMFELTEDFWSNSLFSRPSDREVICDTSAWDFFSSNRNETNERFRIEMCSNANQVDFLEIHHEMGRTEYQMAYSNLPLIYRQGANPGFHEAIGATIGLSVSTPNHLLMINNSLTGNLLTLQDSHMVQSINDTTKMTINYLMKQALDKVAFLPFAYIMDSWRSELFAGEFDSSVYNKVWWQKRIDFQGVRPPISRTANTDFDIGSEFHIPTNVPFIKYFFSTILQFQFQERLCQIAQIDDPIYFCDIYNNTDAGNAILALLSKGASEPWQDQLAEFLNKTEGKLDASALLTYFKPLIDFLEEEHNTLNYDIGWSSSSEVINDYIKKSQDISAIVPIIVGAVLAVLVIIVITAFFLGQRNRKKQEAKALENKVPETEKNLEKHLEQQLEKHMEKHVLGTENDEEPTRKQSVGRVSVGKVSLGMVNEALEIDEK